jgi:hypothetical protein
MQTKSISLLLISTGFVNKNVDRCEKLSSQIVFN